MYETFNPELQVLGWAEKHTKPHSKSILFSKNNVLCLGWLWAEPPLLEESFLLLEILLFPQGQIGKGRAGHTENSHEVLVGEVILGKEEPELKPQGFPQPWPPQAPPAHLLPAGIHAPGQVLSCSVHQHIQW